MTDDWPSRDNYETEDEYDQAVEDYKHRVACNLWWSVFPPSRSAPMTRHLSSLPVVRRQKVRRVSASRVMTGASFCGVSGWRDRETGESSSSKHSDYEDGVEALQATVAEAYEAAESRGEKRPS